MRATYLSAIVAGLIVLAGQQSVSGQGSGRVGPLPRAEAVALNDLVDGAAEGKGAGSDAWLKWNSHFVRAADGKVYVPFTVTLDDAGAGFESIAMYVRVMPRGTKGPAGSGRVSGSDIATPVSAPERQFSRGNPTAGEASARLGLMATEFGRVRRPRSSRTLTRPSPNAGVRREGGPPAGGHAGLAPCHVSAPTTTSSKSPLPTICRAVPSSALCDSRSSNDGGCDDRRRD